MTTPAPEDQPAETEGTLRTIWRTLLRLVGDVLALTLWVVFLTLLFLETAWPRWAFYALLLGGVALYVSITAPWTKRPTQEAAP